eukprot:scaffold1004_cov269-Pinguiococcus_pyrenoidosus.AAC.5
MHLQMGRAAGGREGRDESRRQEKLSSSLALPPTARMNDFRAPSGSSAFVMALITATPCAPLLHTCSTPRSPSKSIPPMAIKGVSSGTSLRHSLTYRAKEAMIPDADR